MVIIYQLSIFFLIIMTLYYIYFIYLVVYFYSLGKYIEINETYLNKEIKIGIEQKQIKKNTSFHDKLIQIFLYFCTKPNE